jgi:hypothetical protein
MRKIGHSVTLLAFLTCAACGSGSQPGAATDDASAGGTGAASSGSLSHGGATLPGFQNPPVDARLKTLKDVGRIR